MAGTILAADVVVDESLYPRHTVDAMHVARLAEALRAGATFPPIVVEKGSKRLVDGLHRLRATQQVQGADDTIAVRYETYDSDAAFFLAAVAANTSHGQGLTTWDAMRCIQIAESLSVDPEQVATALNMRTERLGKLTVSRLAVGPQGQPQPLKRTLRHMAGRPITAAQLGAQQRLSGMSGTFYLNQVRLLAEHELFEETEETRTAAATTAAALEEWLERHPEEVVAQA